MSEVVTERDIIVRLLKQFKKSPCLWDTSDKYYFNKPVRHEHFEKMLGLWQKMEPNGTVETLKKKLEHYRAAYRREWKKVANSKLGGASPDSVHRPNLWYYPLLTFLNKKPGDTRSSDEDNENPSLPTPPKKKRRTSQTKREENSSNKHKSEKQETCTEAKSNTEDYVTTYGQTIARQLQELDDEVRYEAERIISDVIYRARMGTLPKYSQQSVELFIPQSGPSWYDLPNQDSGQQTDCLVVRVATPTEPMFKTEFSDTVYQNNLV